MSFIFTIIIVIACVEWMLKHFSIIQWCGGFDMKLFYIIHAGSMGKFKHGNSDSHGKLSLYQEILWNKDQCWTITLDFKVSISKLDYMLKICLQDTVFCPQEETTSVQVKTFYMMLLPCAFISWKSSIWRIIQGYCIEKCREAEHYVELKILIA